ncbi:MAG: hypothetical protein UY63_C0009G0017 [Parcubacteria group bacterium GW2011_GWA2_51_10]|nr:MAG: hypothetical protein UY63_C0009G0017 [Parcubacteria group bacterium GW2011_GWA2_51_10]
MLRRLFEWFRGGTEQEKNARRAKDSWTSSAARELRNGHRPSRYVTHFRPKLESVATMLGHSVFAYLNAKGGYAEIRRSNWGVLIRVQFDGLSHEDRVTGAWVYSYFELPEEGKRRLRSALADKSNLEVKFVPSERLQVIER